MELHARRIVADRSCTEPSSHELQTKAPVSLREAVERARRSEDGHPGSATVSALTSAPTVANRSDPQQNAQAALDRAAANRPSTRTVVASTRGRSNNNPNARASGGSGRGRNVARGRSSRGNNTRNRDGDRSSRGTNSRNRDGDRSPRQRGRRYSHKGDPGRQDCT